MQFSSHSIIVFIIELSLLIIVQQQTTTEAQRNEEQPAAKAAQSPQPIPTASYVSLDGLTLVVIFDKPVNLSSYIESVELRRQNGAADEASESGATGEPLQVRTIHPQFDTQTLAVSENGQCSELNQLAGRGHETQELVHGIQLCARLLTKKTLKLLHKYRLYDCVWPSRVQFLVQLGKPAAATGPIRISFQRQTISELDPSAQDDSAAATNEREISLDLNRLPLEGLGVPLAPRLAITGPNQVTSCGQFVLSAHLSSPFGTQPDESVKLSWSVERVGFTHSGASSSSSSLGGQQQQQPPMMLFNGSQLSPAVRANQINADSQSSEVRWKLLQQLVGSSRSNSLVLDSQLLQFSPQIYEFRLSASFSTSLTSVSLNASHQVSRLDFETPMGAIYGSHILAQQPQLNTNQDLLLLADIQVPDCAQSIKQVGLYWQVSDSRVRFEQTYAPYYLARPSTLPEQSQIEFRLNLFYGIRVKKASSTSALITTGDSVLDAQISGGALVLNIGQDSTSGQLELLGGGSITGSDQQQQLQQVDKYTYQWSCFDGKTAQPCFKSIRTGAASNSSSSIAADTVDSGRGAALQSQSSGLPLIDRQQQRQVNLRLPLSWLDPEAQLWFGLQRFDRGGGGGGGLGVSGGGGGGGTGSTGGAAVGSQQAQTEYALVELQPGHSATLSIGPILVGTARQHRATLRNPLTGAILLLANSPAVIVGRLSPADEIRSFAWHSPNFMGQLHWTWRNTTNPITGQQEILTELHLSAQQQVAHAHNQIQLVACTRHAGQQLIQNELMTASLNLDTVQSVSQCRVGATLLSQSTLAVSVEHCNIPLGLSPITYQIYLVDTTGLDGFVAENNPPAAGSGGGGGNSASSEDDYLNEADVAFFESQAQPLTMPQLSPVFVLNGFNPLSLAALLGGGGAARSEQPALAVRFGGRVCDRLQTCRTFYSPPVGLKQLLAQWQLRLAGPARQSANQSLPLTLAVEPPSPPQQFGRQQASSLLQSLQSMIDGSKRANMAGNSIGAISILNSAMTLGQRLLDGATSGESGTEQAEGSSSLPPPPPPQASKLLLNFRDRVRDLLLASMRDCLHYGSVSLQRQFHYTDSGQTNLVLHALTRILATPQSNIELKFRALKLMAQLTRRTIQEQLSLRSNCLADLRTIERAYESLFGTFAHFAIDSPSADPAGAAAAADPQLDSNQQAGNSSSSSSEPGQRPWANYSTLSGEGGAGGRKKRGQEAALAYLRSVRLAYRSLLAAAAIQLPLGESHTFRYSAAAPSQLLATAASSRLRAAQSIQWQARSRSQPRAQLKPLSHSQLHRSDQLRSAEATATATATTTTTTSGDINGSSAGANKLETTANKLPLRTAASPLLLLAPPLISSDILSSLTHLTGASDLLIPEAATTTTTTTNASGTSKKKSIDVSFDQLGSVSITFDQRFLQRLATLVKEGRLLCRNDTSGAPATLATAAPSPTTTTTATTTTPAASTSTSALPLTPTLSAGNGAGAGGGSNCSSFVLALTSFAGKAPFRSLDEGLALRVPHVEVGLLSPLDGSDLLGLQHQDEELLLAAGQDLSTEVTFAIPNLDGERPSGQQHDSAGHSAARRRYKCYQFDEELNEWSRVAQGERNEIEQQEKRIRCTFRGLGVFAAFQGKPPPAEAPLKSPVVLGLLALIALIIIISASLCCCSSSGGGAGNGSSKGANDSSSGNSSDNIDDRRDNQRHPEQTFRSDFDYPQVGGG